jgi:hypothetical protein
VTYGGFEPLPEEEPVERTPLRRGIGGVLYDIVDPNLDGPLKPSRRQLATLLVYAAASVVYIAIGLTTTDFLLAVWVAIAYLVVAVWLIPAGIRRLRR